MPGAKLTIPEVPSGPGDKLAVLKDLIARYGLTLKQAAYIGDDVNDLQALAAVGFSASPLMACLPVLKVVRYVCKKNGGQGAVRGGGSHPGSQQVPVVKQQPPVMLNGSGTRNL